MNVNVCVCVWGGVRWLYAGSHWGSKSSQCSCINCSWAVRAARPVCSSTSTLFTLPPDTHTHWALLFHSDTHTSVPLSLTHQPPIHTSGPTKTHTHDPHLNVGNRETVLIRTSKLLVTSNSNRELLFYQLFS